MSDRSLANFEQSSAIHPLALLVPEMDADQYADLRDDIARQGLLHAIVLHEGMVLDGRHRLRACEETGTEPRFEEFSGSSPVEFVLSMNVKRRHLTVSQRAAITIAFLPAAEEEARRRQVQAGESFGRGVDSSGSPDPELSGSPHRAREDVGRMAGVSGATIDRARRVAEEDPEMFEQVKAGTLPVRAADNILRERKESLSNGHKPSKPEKGKRLPQAIVRVAQKLDDLLDALNEVALQKSCDGLTHQERQAAAESYSKAATKFRSMARLLATGKDAA